MRELKFRVWNGYLTKEFKAYDRCYTPMEGAYLEIKPYRYDNDCAIEQYTGLKDKNGKEIYEGDIVKNTEGINETAVCIWDESNAEFDFRGKDGKYTRDNVKSWLEMYEVIGNIHENPELCGEEK